MLGVVRLHVVLGLVAISSCGRFSFDPVTARDAASDGEGGDASDAASVLGPFAPPTLVMGLESPSIEYGPSISADGNELQFTSDRGGSLAVYRATRAGTMFIALTELTEIGGSGIEYDPEISGSGLELYFVSSDPPAGLRRSTRSTTADLWGAPEVIALGADHEGPSLAVGDLRMLIATSTGIDEWMRPSPTSTAWQIVRTHTSLVSTTWPAVSANGLEIFVIKTGNKLYRATRASVADEFGAPQPYLFGSVVDTKQIYDPELSADGRTLYLSILVSGDPEIYVTSRS
jgi:hypothetical protein